MRNLLAFSLLLFGCHELPVKTDPQPPRPPEDTSGVGTTPDDSPPGPSTTDSCSNPVVGSVPENGAVNVFYRTAVEMTLTNPDPTAVLSVEVDLTGEVWPGTSSVDGATVRFEGELLAPSTPYLVKLQHACGTDFFRFTTSVVGAPVEADLVGRTYALDLADGTWIEPAGATLAMEVMLDLMRLLVSVTAVTEAAEGKDAQIDFLTGIGVGQEQNRCSPTVELVGSTWEDPFFTATMPSIDLQTDTYRLVIEDFVMTGAIAPDGSFIQGATVSGHLDTRELGEELGLGSDPTAICNLLATLGVSCNPCADGLATCVDAWVEDVPGPQVPIDMRVITPQDVDDTSSCQ